MLFHISNHIKFLLKSTNEHGVHSPFVYDLVTKCFYKKSIYDVSIASNKKIKLLYKLTAYFNFENILEVGNSSSSITHAMYLGQPKAIITTIERSTNISEFIEDTINTSSDSYDLIFFNKNFQKEVILDYFETLLQTTHNDSVFVFDAIYASETMQHIWKTIKLHPQVKVTINTYHLGLVFFRKEQVKEHFTIRV